MSRQLGRISGPLLEANLERNGIDLAFSNDRFDPASTLLYFDVNNNRIGINTETPSRDLLISDTTQTPNLIATTIANIGNFEFTNSRIEVPTGDIIISAGNYVNIPRLQTADIDINDNVLSTYTANTNLHLAANSTGNIILGDSTVIENNLTISGTTTVVDIQATGTISTTNLTIGQDLTIDRAVQLEDIRIDQNNISTTHSNSNLDLSPGGTGEVDIYANTNVTGGLHATGDVTFDGDITLGDANTDDIVLNGEIASNIVPDQSGVYNLGSSTKQWTEVKSVLLNGLDINTAAIAIGGVDIGTPVGNIFYVAVNGSDANRGDHPQGPFATIKHALSVADSSSSGPTVIYVMSGDYQEELPLTVPSNTTVKGFDLRNTIIRPTTSTQSEDVFLLTGETTVEDITIKDFYYDSINDKGYAFRFASNAITTTRSPYIRNVTVITQGSATSAADPRGFASGDAGKGALVDGTDVNSASADAAMLFHSCTFITPGVDALTMTGGVRVEWLNCFSYFANRGLYAFNDAVGRVNQDGSTINKGAELRSIGSASVYGNKGAEADGDETLMYLINHNFAYIGTGKDVSNDATLVIQENETVELNSGKIYYTSQDAGGNFRVGDAFVVDFERGTTSLSDSDVALTGISSLTINTGGDETFINAEKIETGNWRIEDNTISALIGDGNLAAASGTINFTNDVNMQSNLSMTGNFTMSGANFTLGNASGDTVDFEAEITSNIIPATTNTYNLGTISKQWKNIFLSELTIDDISISDNVITTTQSNSNLELLANGTGNINVSDNAVFDNNTTINGITDLRTASLSGDLTHTGTRTTTGNIDVIGNVSVTGKTVINSATEFEDVQINDNYITTTVSNADLELRAAGTGVVSLDKDVEVENNLTVNGTFFAGNIDVDTSLDINDLVVRNNIQIDDNFITTTVSNSNLELIANGNGILLIDSNNTVVDNNLTVDGVSALQNTIVTGTNTVTGTVNQTGNLNITGKGVISNITTRDGFFESISVLGNVVTTTVSNADLELRASGTGNVIFKENVDIPNNVTVQGTVSANNVIVDTNLDLNELVVLNNIEINDNYITTTVSNSNLELRADGTGKTFLADSKFINNILSTDTADIVLDSASNKTKINTTGSLILPVGTTGDRTTLSGSLRYNTSFNLFEGYSTANTAFNGIFSDNYQTKIIAGDTDNTLYFYNNNIETATITDSVNLSALQVDDINFNANIVSTNVSNSDIDLQPDGTGVVVIDNINLADNKITNTNTGGLLLQTTGFGYIKIAGTGAVGLTAGDTASRRSNPEVGEFRFNTQENIAEVYSGTEWIEATGPAGETISAELMGEIVDEWSLILG